MAHAVPQSKLKRFFDFGCAALGLIALSPLLLLIAIAVRVFCGSPILFRQQRPGLNEQPFTLLKFRTMNNSLDKDGNLLPDDERTPWFGHFLRRSSMDELPELINVLRGEMSLVGPRPLLMAFLAHYTPAQSRRHSVRPGITGWAQVNGRNHLSWDEKLALDVWYVDNASLSLDLKILWRTLWTVLSRRGVSMSERNLPPSLAQMTTSQLLLVNTSES